MRWFTCTPRHFVGNQAFLDRDSGLLSTGFRSLGQDSMAVQLGPALPNDLPGVLRATSVELESAAWWKDTGAGGVALFSYGSPGFRNIAEAIVKAGLRLVQVSDTHGVISPWADPGAHFRSQWHHHWYRSVGFRLLRSAGGLASGYFWRGLRRDPSRARMMSIGDYFGASSPEAVTRYHRMLRLLEGPSAAAKVRLLPIPVGAHFAWPEGAVKFHEVVAVGRWDSTQKRTPLLMSAIAHVLASESSVVFRIFGEMTEALRQWHSGLSGEFRQRVKLEGKVTNASLVEAYVRAKVILVSAAYEGCHISSAEAVCCGASVVACRSPFLCAVEWHASHASGRLANRPTGRSLGQALVGELVAWESGQRDPVSISGYWTAIFHPDKVARRVVGFFEDVSQFAAPDKENAKS